MPAIQFDPTDDWTWSPTLGSDVPAIVRMAQDHFETEIDTVFEPDPVAYARNLTHATVAQFYNPQQELLSVAKSQQNNTLLAYTWAIRGERSPWSDQEMISVRMAHVDLSLGVRTRIRLVTQMISIWEAWAAQCGVPILCSTTMRRDQEGFLRIHQRLGWDIRGSYAYKRIS